MTERFWDDKKLASLWKQPLSLAEIGIELGGKEHPFSPGSVRQHASQLGLGPRPKAVTQSTHWKRTAGPEQIAAAEAKRQEAFTKRREDGVRNRPRDIQLGRRDNPAPNE